LPCKTGPKQSVGASGWLRERDDHMTEKQATREELEKQKAEAEKGIEALRVAEGLRAQEAENRIRQQDAELAHISELVSAVARGAHVWQRLHDAAGDSADDPQLLLGLLCLTVGDPVNAKDFYAAYIEGYKRGIDLGDPSPLNVEGFRELQARHQERDDAERARFKAHNAPARR